MKSKSNKTKDLFDEIVAGIKDLTEETNYRNFLKFSKNFNKYSFNNIILIYSQMEDATYVAGFKTWEKMGRKIKKGEKGIQIMYPIKLHYSKTKRCVIKNTESENAKNEDVVDFLTYRPTYVFDISQTEGEPLPIETKYLNSNKMLDFFEALKNFCPYPIYFDKQSSNEKGHWSPTKKEIVLKEDMSIDDKASVLLHELTHALYDNFNYKTDRNKSETFVESVAFIVADTFGLDTSLCSFDYIAYWSDGDVKEIIKLQDKIQKNANEFIEKLKNEFENKNLKIAS